MIAALLSLWLAASPPGWWEGGPYQVGERWSATDTAMEITYLSLHLADWAQTRDTRFAEANPILGPDPSLAKINTYFALTAVGHVAISALLPKCYRHLWQVPWIVAESIVGANNRSIGVRMRF